MTAASKETSAPGAVRRRPATPPAPALLSVVCPACNEADGIGELIRRVSAVIGDTGIRKGVTRSEAGFERRSMTRQPEHG